MLIQFNSISIIQETFLLFDSTFILISQVEHAHKVSQKHVRRSHESHFPVFFRFVNNFVPSLSRSDKHLLMYGARKSILPVASKPEVLSQNFLAQILAPEMDLNFTFLPGSICGKSAWSAPI